MASSISTSTPSASSHHSSDVDEEDPPPQETYESYYVNGNPDIAATAKKIKPLHITNKILATVMLVTFIASVVLMILGFMGKIYPLSCLYPLAGVAALLIVMYVLDKCSDHILIKGGIDPKHHNALLNPKPKKEKKEEN